MACSLARKKVALCARSPRSEHQQKQPRTNERNHNGSKERNVENGGDVLGERIPLQMDAHSTPIAVMTPVETDAQGDADDRLKNIPCRRTINVRASAGRAGQAEKSNLSKE